MLLVANINKRTCKICSQLTKKNKSMTSLTLTLTLALNTLTPGVHLKVIWVKVFKNGPSKIC